ncbi:MAG TPA: efflux RND transporter periplasmic adaptor subunit [Candidatus Binataceae bacterium]|nr:efflux RND transporter periplasmic adaptor subunit [Candidatus Binataceae bacterium]
MAFELDLDVSGQRPDSAAPPVAHPFARHARWTWLAAAIALATAAALYLAHARRPNVWYATAAVSRGAIVRAVNASGTVNPVTTVQVGSYVSGPIIELDADFNTRVKRGQLIARIDPRPFTLKVAQARAQLADAQAAIERDQADAGYKRLLYQRARELLPLGAVAQDTVDQYRSSADQAAAQVKVNRALAQQQQEALAEAEVNLNYANIVSPVDGTVVLRNVDVGQTVAASFQTPVLFLIARDLTRMQIDCNVSEADVGNIRVGQPAAFTVEAFPNRTMQGVVNQIRQAPITVQNVVTYDVVIAIDNRALTLMPGMTADVNIITGHRDDVVRIPVRALHFTPHDARSSQPAAPAVSPGRRVSRVWVMRDGRPAPMTVALGLRNADYAELIGPGPVLGDQLATQEVVGAPSADELTAAAGR